MASTRARGETCRGWARSKGRPCERPAAVDGVCVVHGGFARVHTDWTLADGEKPGALITWPSKRDGHPERERPRRIQRYAALELIRRGKITRGLFARWPGRFMRRVERSGVRVVQELWGPLKAVRFEVNERRETDV